MWAWLGGRESARARFAREHALVKRRARHAGARSVEPLTQLAGIEPGQLSLAPAGAGPAAGGLSVAAEPGAALSPAADDPPTGSSRG